MHVLIVEDEERIAGFLQEGLRAEGYATAVARDGDEAVALGLDPAVGLVILDVMLPRRGGYSVLATLRQQRPGLPVLMLTARSDLESRVGGLNAGADDYLTKPFAFEELVARIRALLRRRDLPPLLDVGGVRLDLHRRTAEVRGRAVELTEREFTLLEHLMRHAGQVVSRQEILRQVWQMDFDPQSTVLETTMNRLRRKLTTPGTPAPIETVRGAGYRLTV